MRDLVPYAAARTETVLYDACPGLGALPDGTGLWLGFAFLQTLPLMTFLWAIWWPAPISSGEFAFSVASTAILIGALAGVIWVLLRRAGGSALGVVIAPFIRLVVSDRRVRWDVPWRRDPLIQIEAWRVRGGILGEVDARGRGSAAIILDPGDYAGDGHGLVHFNRLPRAAAFVDALGRLA